MQRLSVTDHIAYDMRRRSGEHPAFGAGGGALHLVLLGCSMLRLDRLARMLTTQAIVILEARSDLAGCTYHGVPDLVVLQQGRQDGKSWLAAQIANVEARWPAAPMLVL